MSVDDLAAEDGENIEKISQFLAHIWNKVGGNVSNFYGMIAGLIEKNGMPFGLEIALFRFHAEMHFELFKDQAPQKMAYAYQQLLEYIDASAMIYNFESMKEYDAEGITFFNFFPKYDVHGDVFEPVDIGAQLRYIDKKMAALQKRKAALLQKAAKS
jgi:hypothetical protein